MVQYCDNTFNPSVIHLTFIAKPQPWLNQLPAYSAPISEQLEKNSPLCILVFSFRPLILKWGPQEPALQSNHIPLSVCPTSLSDSYFKPHPTLQMDSSFYPFLAEVESSCCGLRMLFSHLGVDSDFEQLMTLCIHFSSVQLENNSTSNLIMRIKWDITCKLLRTILGLLRP